MQYQELGNTGTFVSRLCLGTMTFGGAGTVFGLMGNLGQKEADQLVGKVPSRQGSTSSIPRTRTAQGNPKR